MATGEGTSLPLVYTPRVQCRSELLSAVNLTQRVTWEERPSTEKLAAPGCPIGKSIEQFLMFGVEGPRPLWVVPRPLPPHPPTRSPKPWRAG